MFRRIANLFRGFVGLFISRVEKANPEVLLEVERENLRKQIAKYNEGLVSHAALCERIMTQVKKLTGEESELRARIKAHINTGHRDAAAQLALRRQALQQEQEEYSKQLSQAQETYQNFLKARDVSVTAATRKLESLRANISELKVKQAMAELAEMTTGLVTSVGGSGDTFNRLQEMVDQQREEAAGRMRVAADTMDTTEIELKEAEQKAMAENALADFAAQEGIPLEAESTTEGEADSSSGTTHKSMGPAAETEES